jgi:O-antigen biosynthesis protein WbqP
MKVNSTLVVTQLAGVSSNTGLFYFLCKYKLNRLLQLRNLLKDEVSLVGSRPYLFNQTELIEERKKRGVYRIRPGITGLAQINKIDMPTPQLLAEMDTRMISQLNAWCYFK